MEKAAVIDKHAEDARRVLMRWFDAIPRNDKVRNDFWREVVQVAKARHILGHYEYGDTNLFEWSDGKVRAAIIEELADAVVYQAWLEERAATPPESPKHYHSETVAGCCCSRCKEGSNDGV